MKKVLLTFVFVLLSAHIAFGWAGEVTGDAGIYKNKTRKTDEKALLDVSSGDNVEVIKSAGGKYKVKHYSGTVGYIEKSKVRKAQKIGGGKNLTFSGENIMGELGEIEGVFLFEDDQALNKGLKVERSFKEEMKAPEDKENLERKHTEYIKW